MISSAPTAGDALVLGAAPWSDQSRDDYEGPDVHIEISCAGLHAKLALPAYVADIERLGLFVHEIDRQWRGWPGELVADMRHRDWLSVSAKHDGRGHVHLTVEVAEGWPMAAEWSARATIAIDIGSAAAIARDLDRWSALVWPPEHRAGVHGSQLDV